MLRGVPVHINHAIVAASDTDLFGLAAPEDAGPVRRRRARRSSSPRRRAARSPLQHLGFLVDDGTLDGLGASRCEWLVRVCPT